MKFKTKDRDIIAFVRAAGLTNGNHFSAVSYLVTALKSNNLWDKMEAIYPIIGGTASSHKYNLKNPQDTNGAFRLTFSGTITHSSTGIISNGSSGVANTNLTPSTTLSLNDTHISMYSRTTTNDSTAFRDMGVSTNGGVNNTVMLIRFANNHRYQINSNTLSLVAASTGAGLYLMNRVNSTNQEVYMNGSLMGSALVTSSGLPTRPIYLMAINSDGVTAFYSTRQYAFITIGKGLSSTEVSYLYSIIRQYQTILGRQV